MGGIAPNRPVNFEFLSNVLRPDWPSRRGVENAKIAHRSQGVHTPLVNQRSGSRPTWVGNSVGAIVFILPDEPAVFGVQTQNPLSPWNAFASGSNGLAGRIPSP